MIDLHSHVLPGLDDGARDLEESVAMARAAAADGTTVLAATPHVRDDYPTPADAMERALAELRSRLDLEGIALRVVSGGELALDSNFLTTGGRSTSLTESSDFAPAGSHQC